MASAPAAGALFSPLDEELGLLPGRLTPLLQEQSVRLGQAVESFAEAAGVLESFTRVKVSESTVRRLTEAAGGVLVAEETAAVDDPEPLAGGEEEAPERLFLAVDGAMVPVLHGEWREVRTLAIGVPEPAAGLPRERADQEVRCRRLSYFSRLEDAKRFTELAAVEMRRRRVAEAKEVAGAADGALWCQGVFAEHRPDALRILDFGHAGEYVSASGRLLFGETGGKWWTAVQLHRLKHQGGGPVIQALQAWEATVRKPAEREALGKNAAYLANRAAMLAYPAFRAAGWPIASSMVESANKLVVERRLKGAGMHWAEANVNPMLALRCASRSDRWDHAWQQITAARLLQCRAPTAKT